MVVDPVAVLAACNGDHAQANAVEARAAALQAKIKSNRAQPEQGESQTCEGQCAVAGHRSPGTVEAAASMAAEAAAQRLG
eukprot:10467971-Karenia_brevis.AAC.1